MNREKKVRVYSELQAVELQIAVYGGALGADVCGVQNNLVRRGFKLKQLVELQRGIGSVEARRRLDAVVEYVKNTNLKVDSCYWNITDSVRKEGQNGSGS